MVYNMKTKKIILLIILLSTIFFNGCLGSREISDLGLTISIGIDKAENGYLVTHQVLNPKAIASKNATYEAPTIIHTQTGEDLFDTIRRVTTLSPRKLYNSHLRAVIFGEDFAKEGIQNTMDYFMRDHEFRTDFYFLVAKGTTANEVLKTVTPLEAVSGMQLFSSIEASEKAYAPTKSTKIIELVNELISDGTNPVLTGVEINKLQENSTSIDALKDTFPTKLKLVGLGAFKKDKLVGWLDESESKGHNYITGNVKNTVGYVNIDKENKITCEVIKAKSKLKAQVHQDKPSIDVKIDLLYNVAAVTGDYDVSVVENAEKISRLMENKISDICKSAIKKAQTEFKSDIFGFGEEIHRANPKLWAKLKKDWNNEFTKLPVNIIVHCKINGIGVNTKSMFEKEEK